MSRGIWRPGLGQACVRNLAGMVFGSLLTVALTLPSVAQAWITPPLSWWNPNLTPESQYAFPISWQIQYTGTDFYQNPLSVNVYNVDLFDTGKDIILKLQEKQIRVICYFSAGTYEDWREDANQFPEEALGKKNGWPGERWLDIRNNKVRDIMATRITIARDKNCDAVDPDNVDGWSNNTGFSLTQQDEFDYLTYLASTAHDAGLAIGLKNNVEQASELVGLFDFAVNEECFRYGECGALQKFIDAKKPVFHIEYSSHVFTKFCKSEFASKFDSLQKKLSLDASYEICK